MAPLYCMLSIAGWAFFVGLLGYLIVRGRRTDAAAKIERPEEAS